MTEGGRPCVHPFWTRSTVRATAASWASASPAVNLQMCPCTAATMPGVSLPGRAATCLPCPWGLLSSFLCVLGNANSLQSALEPVDKMTERDRSYCQQGAGRARPCQRFKCGVPSGLLIGVLIRISDARVWEGWAQWAAQGGLGVDARKILGRHS